MSGTPDQDRERDELDALARECEDPTLDEVVVDAEVLLRLEQHCRDGLPQTVTGQLLGMDAGSRLEVTHSFPFPNAPSSSDDGQQQGSSKGSSAKEQEQEEQAGVQYQMAMMRLLPAVNADAFTVGWYSSSSLGEWVNGNLIEIMLSYQRNPLVTRKSVVLLFDPLLSSLGKLSLRAMRLTQAFLALAEAESSTDDDAPLTYTQEALSSHGLTFNDIFEEIPVRLRTGAQAAAFLTHVQPQLAKPTYDHLDLSTNLVLERNVDLMSGYLDLLRDQQSRFANYLRYKGQQQARGREEGKAPNRLESMLATNQLSLFCDQIQDFARDGFAKLLAMQALHGGADKQEAA